MLKEPIEHQPKAVKDILEVEETHLKISRKGQRGGRADHKGRLSSDFIPVLVGRVRGPPCTLDKAMASMAKTEIHAALVGCVDPATTVLCMDSHKSFLERGKMLGVARNIFVTTKAKPADFHVQSVNSCHERLKTWIDYRLRGVASKYMPSCLAWQRLRTWKEMSSTELISCALRRQIINL